MIMIIGGAYQGKVGYAKEHFKIDTWADGYSCSFEELCTCTGVKFFHAFIRRELEAGHDVTDLAKTLYERNPQIILISDEVGYGVVPIDASERAYREKVGRVCTKLAAYATQVHRVVCGIGTVIKHA